MSGWGGRALPFPASSSLPAQHKHPRHKYTRDGEEGKEMPSPMKCPTPVVVKFSRKITPLLLSSLDVCVWEACRSPL